MKFTALFSSLTLVCAAAAQSLSYDPIYDDAEGSLGSVACSDGANGLLTAGYTTFGSLPGFPNIGGVPAVEGWNSAACGTCWQVTYTDAAGVTRSENIIAVDVGPRGFNLAQGAMDKLTGNQAEALGRIDVSSVQVDESACGL
ncbi:snodprot1 [Coprinopsis sp. MPI-PUGE-AT-0042]|nr:snodprot1 [Coprinopsis sp. MPI-PUGE-AT-0042]